VNRVIETLIRKGVRMPNPRAVEVGPEVHPDQISARNVTIHTGCKLYGEQTWILDDVTLGKEAPATVINCQVGPQVQLWGGFFENATFLEGASFGSGAHVRGGTILEEQASCAHTVGLKQTILFPFVTLGSLINFCDCFMAGGTGPKNHSEVGSAYIHFNFSANQDKATASLLGDVPQGVMLNQPPIFLGGQGGLVGPSRINFGNVIAAGSICRRDIPVSGKLILESRGSSGALDFHTGVYTKLKRLATNNVVYLANMLALRQWYLHIRPLFVGRKFPQPLCDGLQQQIERVIGERTARLNQLINKAKVSLEYFAAQSKISTSQIKVHKALIENQKTLMDLFHQVSHQTFLGEEKLYDRFQTDMSRLPTQDSGYIETIQAISKETRSAGTRWLHSVVDEVVEAAAGIIPGALS